jgi:hypothetical protein
VDVSHINRRYYDDTGTPRSRYEQAYIVEQTKLAQSVTVRKDLEAEIERLKREIAYYQHQLVPDYERLVSCQKTEIKEMQQRLQHCEDRFQILEQKRCEELEEHRKATEAMVELLKVNEENLEARKTGAKQGSRAGLRVSARLQHRNGVVSQTAAGSLRKSGPVKRCTRGRVSRGK